MENFKKLGLDALIMIGGDGSMAIAEKLLLKVRVFPPIFEFWEKVTGVPLPDGACLLFPDPHVALGEQETVGLTAVA